MSKKVKAFRVTEEALKAGRMLNYREMCEGEQDVLPVAVRKINSYGYHVLEDSKGGVFIIKDKYVSLNKLDTLTAEVKTDYFKPRGQQVLPIEGILDETLTEVEEESTESTNVPESTETGEEENE